MIPEESADSSRLTGGVTLLDLFLMISGGWAIPWSVEVTFGPSSTWRIPAYILGGVGGLFWAWYFKNFEWLLQRTLLVGDRAKTADGTPPVRAAGRLYLGTLALSLLCQYALFRALCFMLLKAVIHR